jgi:hypothetical protein
MGMITDSDNLIACNTYEARPASAGIISCDLAKKEK